MSLIPKVNQLKSLPLIFNESNYDLFWFDLLRILEFLFRVRNEELKYQTLPVKPKRSSSSTKRFHSDERPSKRLKWTSSKASSLGPPNLPPTRPGTANYFTLPHSSSHNKKSQKVTKTASFHFSSPFSAKSVTPTTTAPPSVKRENSLTSKLQAESLGIHKLIFDRLNNNESAFDSVRKKCDQCAKSHVKCFHLVRKKLLGLEEQRKLVKFRRFLRAANIANKVDFLRQIETIRRRQKREARRSIVDEHGVPAFTQLR